MPDEQTPDDQNDVLSNSNFLTTFVLPALWMFLVPVCSLWFFHHVQAWYDEQAFQDFATAINNEPGLTDQERQKMILQAKEIPFSTLILDPEVAEQVDGEARFHYATFRWGIRLSLWSLAGGVAVIGFVSICVLLSTRSQTAQLYGLGAGWHVLRIYSALSAIAQGVLLVALSYWVTAFWMNVYIPKLIIVVAIVVLLGVGAVLKGIFVRVPMEFTVDGDVLHRDDAPRLWEDLSNLCQKVGTNPPDQIVAGIDDSFFVTETPVTVKEKLLEGRTLFVSYSLLRQLDGNEADAVMAHEMAHFSGNDTVYSRRIQPMLARFDRYCYSLHEGGITVPVFHFMHCFRALYQLSIGRVSRQREFRADKIAADATSPRDIASALLKVVAFSKYRGDIERQLFEREEVLASANISEQIDTGFRDFAVSFASTEQATIGELETTHPFDSHPPISARMQALGLELNASTINAYLADDGDGYWYRNIVDAEQREQSQWSEYEAAFREMHEQSLAYRFLPSNDSEAEVVRRFFPDASFESKDGTSTITIFGITYPTWEEPVTWESVKSCQVEENVLKIFRKGGSTQRINLGRFRSPVNGEFLGTFEHFYGRYLAVIRYIESSAENQIAES